MKKTVLITGGSSGIGLACAKALISDCNVIICSRNFETINTCCSELEKNGSVVGYRVDVRNFQEVETLFQELDKNGVKIDILINSAGVALDLENLEKSSTEDWNEMIDTNLKGLLFFLKNAIRRMKENNNGHIINIGSIAGINSYSKGIVYSATKAAVKSISDGLRKELVQFKIKVTNIQPGLVETNFSNIRFKGNKSKAKEVYKGIIPLTGEDIADIIRYVISLPKHVQINEITVTPVNQATVEIIHRDYDLI